MMRWYALPALCLTVLTVPARASYHTFDEAGQLATVGVAGFEFDEGIPRSTEALSCLALLDDRLNGTPTPAPDPGGLIQPFESVGAWSFVFEPPATPPILDPFLIEDSGPCPEPDELSTGMIAEPGTVSNALAPEPFSPGTRRPASLAMFATGLLWVGVSMSRSRSRRHALWSEGTTRMVAGPKLAASPSAPAMSAPLAMGVVGADGAQVLAASVGAATVPKRLVEFNLRVTPAELAALEWLRDECSGPGGFDEAKAAAGIKRILGTEVVELLCANVPEGGRRTVKLRVHHDP
jgi:hypothetical protein